MNFLEAAKHLGAITGLTLMAELMVRVNWGPGYEVIGYKKARRRDDTFSVRKVEGEEGWYRIKSGQGGIFTLRNRKTNEKFKAAIHDWPNNAVIIHHNREQILDLSGTTTEIERLPGALARWTAGRDIDPSLAKSEE